MKKMRHYKARHRYRIGAVRNGKGMAKKNGRFTIETTALTDINYLVLASYFPPYAIEKNIQAACSAPLLASFPHSDAGADADVTAA